MKNKAQADSNTIVWVAVLVLVACLIIAAAVNLLPMLFKAIASVFVK